MQLHLDMKCNAGPWHQCQGWWPRVCLIWQDVILSDESNEPKLFVQTNRVDEVNKLWRLEAQMDLSEVFCCHLLYVLEILNGMSVFFLFL